MVSLSPLLGTTAVNGAPLGLLGFAGDCFLGSTAQSENAFGALASDLPPGTRLCLNFEGTLYPDQTALVPAREKILLDSPIELLGLLDPLPLSLVGVGNNHIGDYGNQIAQFTIDQLARRWAVFGAGVLGATFHLAHLELGGARVGLAHYCTSDTTPLFASRSRIGPLPLSLAQAGKDSRFLRQTSDHAVAIVHWGLEDFHHPRPGLLRLGRRLVDAGFRVVIGHHSHTAQGFERYGDGWIFYSLGNLYFADHGITLNGCRYEANWMARRSWGLVPIFEFSKATCSLQEVRIVTQARNRPPIWSHSHRLKRKLVRMSRALAHPSYVRFHRRACHREGLVNRWQEFLNRRNKGATVYRKFRQLLKIGF